MGNIGCLREGLSTCRDSENFENYRIVSFVESFGVSVGGTSQNKI